MTFNHLILKDYVFPSPSILYLKEAFSVLSFYFLKAFSAASVRPLSDDYFITVLDNSNKLPKAEQMRAVEEFFSNEVLVVGIQPPPSTY
jgi:hypothetical protein